MRPLYRNTKKYFILLNLLFAAWQALAQNADTLRLTRSKADQLFQENNLSLLVQRYQIDAAKAAKIQAGLFLNPDIKFEGSLINTQTGMPLDIFLASGQKFLEIGQTFRIAGQRNAALRLAEQATKLSEAQYFDLVRTLKFQLHQSFYNVYFLQKTASNINRQLTLLNRTLGSLRTQYEKGNVSLRELSRLEAAYYALSNERADIFMQIIENQKIIQTLLVNNTPLSIEPSADELNIFQTQNLALPNLTTLALHNRTDLKIAENNLTYQELNLDLQRRLAKPDLRIGLVYDQSSNYVPHYLGVNAAMPLPIFNKNQGNIEVAKIQAVAAKTDIERIKYQINTELQNALNQLNIVENQISSMDKNFETRLELLSQGLLDNYTKNNISLLEFTDLFESYNNAIQQMNQLRAKRIVICETLNFLTGTELFKK